MWRSKAVAFLLYTIDKEQLTKCKRLEEINI